MEKFELLNHLTKARSGKIDSTKFSLADGNRAAVNDLKEFVGIDPNTPIDKHVLRKYGNEVFDLIEESVDEILPQKIEDVFGQFAEVRQFPRGSKIEFDISRIGRARAKLVISKGAREGIYRAARLDNKYFSVDTRNYTAGVSIGLEEILAGTRTLAERYQDIVEGFEEELRREVYNELATGASLTGYDRINGGDAANVTVAKEGITGALDKVLPYVAAYGVPTIFGSYAALSAIYNPLANSVAAAGYPNSLDSIDVRNQGYVSVYKGYRLVVLPNYLRDLSNDAWFYNPSYVFVIPGDVKPVKIAMEGETLVQRNQDAVGGEAWHAQKLMGVGIARANNFAVIKVSDIVANASGRNASDYDA